MKLPTEVVVALIQMETVALQKATGVWEPDAVRGRIDKLLQAQYGEDVSGESSETEEHQDPEDGIWLSGVVKDDVYHGPEFQAVRVSDENSLMRLQHVVGQYKGRKVNPLFSQNELPPNARIRMRVRGEIEFLSDGDWLIVEDSNHDWFYPAGDTLKQTLDAVRNRDLVTYSEKYHLPLVPVAVEPVPPPPEFGVLPSETELEYNRRKILTDECTVILNDDYSGFRVTGHHAARRLEFFLGDNWHVASASDRASVTAIHEIDGREITSISVSVNDWVIRKNDRVFTAGARLAEQAVREQLETCWQQRLPTLSQWQWDDVGGFKGYVNNSTRQTYAFRVSAVDTIVARLQAFLGATFGAPFHELHISDSNLPEGVCVRLREPNRLKLLCPGDWIFLHEHSEHWDVAGPTLSAALDAIVGPLPS